MHFRKKTFSFFGTVGFLGFMIVASLCKPSFATTLIEVPREGLFQGAGWIGRVQILGTSVKSEESFPCTEVSAKILEVFKGAGAVGDIITFHSPGGATETKTVQVLGFPHFHNGQEYILPLEGHSSSVCGQGLAGWKAFKILHQAGAMFVANAGTATLAEKRSSDRSFSLYHDQRLETYDQFLATLYRSLD